jgi:hypothetical protein
VIWVGEVVIARVLRVGVNGRIGRVECLKTFGTFRVARIGRASGHKVV